MSNQRDPITVSCLYSCYFPSEDAHFVTETRVAELTQLFLCFHKRSFMKRNGSPTDRTPAYTNILRDLKSNPQKDTQLLANNDVAVRYCVKKQEDDRNSSTLNGMTSKTFIPYYLYPCFPFHSRNIAQCRHRSQHLCKQQLVRFQLYQV